MSKTNVDTYELDNMSNRSAERQQFLNDIVATAVEGGTNYWATVDHYQWVQNWPWNDPDNGKVQLVVGTRNERTDTYAVLIDQEDEDHGPLTVDADAVAHGIQLIVNCKVGVAENYCKRIVEASRCNDAGYLDAYDCDMIVQAGVFNEIIYG